MYDATETSSPIAVAGSVRSSDARATPKRETTPDAASERTLTGTPMTWSAGKRPELPARPDRRLRRGWRDRVEPERFHECHALGTAGEHGLRTEIRLDSGNLTTQQLAAGARRRFEHRDLNPTVEQQRAGRCQTGNPGADDHDLRPRRSGTDRSRGV